MSDVTWRHTHQHETRVGANPARVVSELTVTYTAGRGMVPSRTVLNLAACTGIDSSVRRNVSPLTSSQAPFCPATQDGKTGDPGLMRMQGSKSHT